MLELRPTCEHCNKTLDANADEARICTYECTFCVECATWQLLGICPNCSGELVARPRRPADRLAADPASELVVHNAADIEAHQATVLARLRAGELPSQVWTVSFANGRPADGVSDGYTEMGEAMDALAKEQPGFIGVDSVRSADGLGITVSRWTSIAAMVAWRRVAEHQAAQQQGRQRWYRWYRSDVARVDRSSDFVHQQGAGQSRV
jgi:uncharacterized protein